MRRIGNFAACFYVIAWMAYRNQIIKRNCKYGIFCLFKNPQKKTEISVFERAGFTQELFIDYISSIVQRVGYMDYRGHENDKVLVVLPDQFRPAWNATGGNGYAEQIIAATLKVLPDFISQNISAVSCGGANPEASVLKGYQLIFMESGFAKEWVNSEYSIIDLQNKKSYVSGDLDTSYGNRFFHKTFLVSIHHRKGK